MLLKPNQIGTISEATEAAHYAQAHGYKVVGSGRAGGIDDPVTDIAFAVGAQCVKYGAPRSGERIGMYNCLLRFEEELGSMARFAGPQIFAPSTPAAKLSR
jgi:enolase